MTMRAVVVVVLLAAIIVPIILAEVRRFRPRGSSRVIAKRPPKPPPSKTPLRLVVNRNDMDRELASLLAKDSPKPREPDA